MGRGWQLTVDEWFYHWFGEADTEKVELVTSFFFRLLEVCDKIVIKHGSPLAKKFFELAEFSVNNYPPKDWLKIKLLINNFFRSDKVHIIYDVTEIDEDTAAQLPRHDVYLVQICMETNEKIIITTDGTLYQNLIDTKDILGIRVYMAKDFIASYPDF